MSPSTPYTDVLGIRPQPAPRREQTPVLFPGKLLPIDIYDVHDSFLSQSISPYSTASSSDSRTLTDSRENNDIPSVAVEHMDQIPHAAIP